MLDVIRKLKNRKSKKGFIFTLLALLVIAFMIIEVSIYFSTFQIRQESAPMKIRTRIVEEFANQLTRANVEKASYISAYNAVYTLAQDCAATPISTGNSTENISNTISSLIWNGTRWDTGKVFPAISDGTLEKWKTRLELLAQNVSISLNVSCTNFIVNQSDPWTVQINYTFSYNLTDNYTKTKISDVYDVAVNVSIYGFEDPLFKNKTATLDPQGVGYVKNIFPYNGTVNTTKKFDTNSNATGRGWFYGELFKGPEPINSSAEFNESDFSPENKKKILYTNNRFLAENYSDMFGAVIYRGIAYSTIGSMISVPFIAVSENTIMPHLPSNIFIKSGSDTGYTTGNFTIYDIDDVTNFVRCGYYTLNPEAPSFFDRLSAGRPDVRIFNKSVGFGIETTIVGNWTSSGVASIDYEYYSLTSGTKVMGMTGCKFVEICKDNIILPKFFVSSSHISTYGLNDLVCNGPNAGRCG